MAIPTTKVAARIVHELLMRNMDKIFLPLKPYEQVLEEYYMSRSEEQEIIELLDEFALGAMKSLTMRNHVSHMSVDGGGAMPSKKVSSTKYLDPDQIAGEAYKIAEQMILKRQEAISRLQALHKEEDTKQLLPPRPQPSEPFVKG